MLVKCLLPLHNNPRTVCVHHTTHFLLIVRSDKPHTIGEELILPEVREVLQTVARKSPDQIIEAFPSVMTLFREE